jgi:hypothetical protein
VFCNPTPGAPHQHIEAQRSGVRRGPSRWVSINAPKHSWTFSVSHSLHGARDYDIGVGVYQAQAAISQHDE